MTGLQFWPVTKLAAKAGGLIIVAGSAIPLIQYVTGEPYLESMIRRFFESDPEQPAFIAPPPPNLPPKNEPGVNAPPLPPPVMEPAPSNPVSEQPNRLLIDAIMLEHLDHAERSGEPFPMEYFRQQLTNELGEESTSASDLRVAVAFVEPKARRREAHGTTVIGYLLVAIPSRPKCELRFDLTEVSGLSSVRAGIMRAISQQISAVADWIRRASREEQASCPI